MRNFWDTIYGWPWSKLVPTAIALVSLGVSLSTRRDARRPADLRLIPEHTGPAAYGLQWGPVGGWGFLLLIRLPIVVANRGRLPGALLDARLVCPQSWTGGRPLDMWEFFDSLDPRSRDGLSFAHPIVVEGAATNSRFVEFRAELPNDEPPILTAGTHTIRMLVRTDEATDWHEAWTFNIDIDERALGGMTEGDGNVHWNPAAR